MPSLPIEVLLGIYLGLLAGIVPALVAGTLGFVVRYFTGVSLPGFGVVVLALAVASVNGGLLALVDPAVTQSARLLIAVVVVLMLSLYAHSQGDRLGEELPHRVSLTSLRKQTLSADVVEFVGGIGQVTVRPTGEVADLEGYPPLSPELRATIREDSWRLPADLPLDALEARLEDRLRTDHDLADVRVSIDEKARASIAAAPPSSGLSKRVPSGSRAVSVDALVPTGLARGDEVVVGTSERSVRGTVLSVRTEEDARRAAEAARIRPGPADATGDATSAEPAGTAAAGVTLPGSTPAQPANGTGSEEAPAAARPSRTGRPTAGGEGRVTVTVSRRDARALLAADRGRVVVRSRGTSSEFDAFSLLRRAGLAVRRVSVGASTPVDPPAGDDADPPVTVLAVRRSGTEVGDRRRGWTFAPAITRPLEPGDEVFVAGTDDALDRFEEEVVR